MKVSESQTKLLNFLKKQEAQARAFTFEEAIQETGWKPSTLKTYLNKGQLSDFVSTFASDKYKATNTVGLDLIGFGKLLSQSKHRRGIGHTCKYELSKALLKKSRENILLALELYNRPSLENRLDGFTFLFCAAWEQLLKAIIIEKEGEKVIYKNTTRPGGIRETISLRDCLEKYFEPQSFKKKNLEKIAYFRDQAVHLLMPELQNSFSRLFQSGVLNFFEEYQKFAQQPVMNTNNSGFISLVGDMKDPSVIHLSSQYGKTTGEEISNLLTDLRHEIESNDHIEFAIPIKVKMVFAKENDDGTIYRISKAEDGIAALKDAIVIEKPVDRNKTHPYLTKKVIELINDGIRQRLGDRLREEHISGENTKKRSTFSTNDFQAVNHKLSYKKSNNKYHHKNENPEIHYYSDALIEDVVSKIAQNKDFLESARKSYSAFRKPK
jgi:EC042_2821-lke REase/Protein of unknown function (DUF3644)